MPDIVYVDNDTSLGNRIAAAWLNMVNRFVNDQPRTQGVNVLNYIPSAEWPAILAGTSTTNLSTALQTAINAEKNLVFPDGLYNIGQKLVMRSGVCLRGVNRMGAKLNGTHAGTMLEFPSGSENNVMQRMYFVGAGNTLMASDFTAGPLKGYIVRPHMTDCDFGYELAYGLDIALIYAVVERCNFMYDGTVGSKPAAGASTSVAIRSVVPSGTTNYPNLNVFRDCQFNGGSATVAQVKITGGTSQRFEKCDFSVGGVALELNDVANCEINHCWFEANAPTNHLIKLDGSSVATWTRIRGCHFEGNTCDRLVQHASTIPNYAEISDCTIILEPDKYVLYNNATTERTLPGHGGIAFFQNLVSGGHASNKLVTGLNFKGGTDAMRFWAIVNTTGAGTLVASSDPGATIVRNSVGYVTITWSNPYCTSASKGCVIASAQSGEARTGAASTNTCEVRCLTSAGAAQEDVFHVSVYGS